MRSLVFAALLLGLAGQAAAQSPPGASAMREGVTVHGDWVIEVRNPDGTLAHRHAFRNALVGGPVLAFIMARGITPGAWSIGLDGNACAPISECRISETAGDVTVTLGPGGTQVVLTGTATANGFNATHFSVVSTRLGVCDPGALPSATCPTITDAPFSAVVLAAPIPITFGQMASVTVTFSFS